MDPADSRFPVALAGKRVGAPNVKPPPLTETCIAAIRRAVVDAGNRNSFPSPDLIG